MTVSSAISNIDNYYPISIWIWMLMSTISRIPYRYPISISHIDIPYQYAMSISSVDILSLSCRALGAGGRPRSTDHDRGHGGAVQLDPMKHDMKARRTSLVTPQCDQLLSTFAFSLLASLHRGHWGTLGSTLVLVLLGGLLPLCDGRPVQGDPMTQVESAWIQVLETRM